MSMRGLWVTPPTTTTSCPTVREECAIMRRCNLMLRLTIGDLKGLPGKLLVMLSWTHG